MEEVYEETEAPEDLRSGVVAGYTQQLYVYIYIYALDPKP